MEADNQALNPSGGKKFQKFELNQMDSSLLSHIMIMLDGYDIAMLWFTGDVKLRYLMSEGRAVTQFVTSFENYYHRLVVAYPCIIDSFPGLKSLQLLASGRKASVSSAQDLPIFRAISSLESLSIGLPYCLGFTSLLQRTPNAFPNLKFLSVLRSEFWLDADLKILPATLDTLEIGRLPSVSKLSLLPSSLTNLTVHGKTTSWEVEENIILPPLTRLIVINSAPPNIRARRGRWHNPNPSPFIASLPRHLECLEFHKLRSRLSDFTNLLPPALTRLKFVSNVEDPVAQFIALQTAAPHLTHLDIVFDKPVPLSIMALVSPTLKYPRIRPLYFTPQQDSDSTWESQPEVPLQNSIGAEFLNLISSLPSNLVALKVSQINASFWTDLTLQSLPKTITSLDIDITEQNQVQNLPPNVTKLHLGSAKHESSPSESALLHLPISITEMDMDYISIPLFRSGWPSRMSRLKKLTTYAATPHLHPSDLRALPPSLTYLRMDGIYRQDVPISDTTFPGKEAWVSAMSHLSFSSLMLHSMFSDPDIIYGLKKGDLQNPLREFVISGIDPVYPLRDDHILSSVETFKLADRTDIMGASIRTTGTKHIRPYFR